ncbi:hypothetical protein K402DRAFT_394811 [Aulographum hederae CBS 113979]|uniref:Nucleoside 2-deoxyribosyltransferase n=1 Tax=Aulographum hederae CBS 113979 TaxID=1176131 RepID=A0A6G1GXG0_9PEZI|nr:hypothetical protein K402DRAFT_394811 [Aulographum hederae CBS 113979]
MSSDPHPSYTLIPAPTQPNPTSLPPGNTTLFLSGSIPSSTSPSHAWRTRLSNSLTHLPLTILDPTRPDWDSSWKESLSDPRFAEQTAWELEWLRKADMVAIWIAEETLAPVTLLELGLCAGWGKRVVVGCGEGYWKRGNVEAVCKGLGVEVWGEWDGFKRAVEREVEGKGDSS